MQITSAAVLALTSLLILPGYCFHYDVSPKVVVVLVGAAIGLLLLLRASILAQVRLLWAEPIGRWFCLLAAAHAISLALASVLSTNAALSWNGGTWRQLGFVSQSAVIVLGFVIVLSCAENGSRFVLRSVAAAGTAVAIYGILQYFGLDPILSPAGYHIGDGVTAIVRPPSTLGHADYFAGYSLYVVFFGGALMATETKTVWKALGVLSSIAGSVAIVLSGTRGAVLGLVFGAIALSIRIRPRLTSRHLAVLAAIFVIGLAFYFSPAGLQLRARRQWAVEDLRGGARIWLWRDSVQMASRRLLVGFGPETFGQEFPRFQSVELSRAYPDFYHESPHNVFLDALVSEGIPGLGVLAGYVGLALFASQRALSGGGPGAPYLGAALAAGVTAGLFACFTLPGYLYFYATVALLVGLTIPVTPNTGRLTQTRSALMLRVPALAFGLTAAAMFVYLAIRVTVSDLALERARLDLASGRLEASYAAYISSQRWHLAGSSDDLYFSRALAAAPRTASNPAGVLRTWQQAFQIAQHAAETSEERQNAWYNLAGFFAAQNNAPAVEACLRNSVHASPNWFKSHWALAQTLLASGRSAEALTEANRAADLDGGKDPEIAKFLQRVHHLAAASIPE